MHTFTEKELVELGFIKENSSDMDKEEPIFYYYTFTSDNAETLITNASDNLINEKYKVEMFNVLVPKSLSEDFIKAYIKEFTI